MEDEPYQDVYFIGIALPPELTQKLGRLKNRLWHNDAELLQPVLPHVTLLHPPSLDGLMPSQLIPQVRQVASRYLPLTIGLTEVGHFGDSVIFVEVQSLKLEALQSQLVKLLPAEVRRLHYRRPYRPHVTIAQKPEPKALDQSLIEAEIRGSITLPQSFAVENISCFKRILPRHYRPHEI
ncbi:MAG TPA: 2'-5' RNA ligase family protein [Candidatus Saccharimonadales bacterium]|nr:2'-5' RNA ligase family protein [Candidatus Saccharimonadales bacterium]